MRISYSGVQFAFRHLYVYNLQNVCFMLIFVQNLNRLIEAAERVDSPDFILTLWSKLK